MITLRRRDPDQTQSDLSPAQSENSTPSRSDRRQDRRTRVSRLIGLTLILAAALGLYHLVFRTEMLDPVLATIGPIREGVDWVLEDPNRAWMGLAMIVIPHIGLYYLFFEER